MTYYNRNPNILIVTADGDGKCDLCGKIEELRSYGPKGENVCFDCGMKNEAAALRTFKQRLDPQ